MLSLSTRFVNITDILTITLVTSTDFCCHDFKRKEMKASRRLSENDIITRGVTVKNQQVAVRGNYENPTNDAISREVNSTMLFLSTRFVNITDILTITLVTSTDFCCHD
jgi:flagellar basal body L-ring protein FlgH